MARKALSILCMVALSLTSLQALAHSCLPKYEEAETLAPKTDKDKLKAGTTAAVATVGAGGAIALVIISGPFAPITLSLYLLADGAGTAAHLYYVYRSTVNQGEAAKREIKVLNLYNMSVDYKNYMDSHGGAKPAANEERFLDLQAFMGLIDNEKMRELVPSVIKELMENGQLCSDPKLIEADSLRDMINHKLSIVEVK
jgi:hypothetical protein